MNAHELLQESAYTLTQRGEQNGYDKKEGRMFTALLIIGILAVQTLKGAY